MDRQAAKQWIDGGRAVLGIELGSTRIKAVLIGEDNAPIAQGSHEWENRLDHGIWTYTLDDVWTGLADCYRDLAANVEAQYGSRLTKLGAVGISAMMHGYLVFDAQDRLLVPFRTWRNTITGEAADRLTELFRYHIPQRWSIAHLYQAMLGGEEHVKDVAFLTTLAGYVHWQLTGEKVLGVGDASGMFPIDSATADYHQRMVEQFDALAAAGGYAWRLGDILPKSLRSGEPAGVLTEAGARRLDPTGTLEAGCPLCPPEGDAGTGMAATNSVARRTGNVSAGTSIFSMVVLEKPLRAVYPELDLVTTPSGDEVAMVHCNNCTSDLNAWVGIFEEFCSLMGMKTDRGRLYGALYRHAMTGDADCGGVLSYNFVSGEPVAGIMDQAGAPMLVRTAESCFTLANLMRAHLYSAFGTLKLGNDILMKKEQVQVDRLMGHGGIFKTKGVAQNILAAAMQAPVTVMETAGEGGAWGIALLASYLVTRRGDETLEKWLDEAVFSGAQGNTVMPDPADAAGFDVFAGRYRSGLAAEQAAIAALRD
ncbi:xylulokinase [Lachnoclostridium sp. Marseille-P6806]|uniref:xylulokinase n=1 Tax=Lachnoclostridium sp. Marseille-P6806 TaxID=2364793 RepID=UPI001032586B|nr:FGGY-family carbohydrate kinase [Lachnoclostridium sp. Marseille-P6806]